MFIDRAHRAWIAIPGRFDQATALATCDRLGYELPRATELVAAISDGLAGGIRLGTLWTAGAKLDPSNQRYASVVDPFTGQARRADVAARHDLVCIQR